MKDLWQVLLIVTVVVVVFAFIGRRATREV